LIRNPRVINEAPSPERYESLTPFLQLFLSRNALRTLPPELWNLQHLSVLSLRNNKLTELPPCIAKLHNLVELNLAGNRLRWLPWELLRLVGPKGNLRRLNVRPNPLFQGVQFHGDKGLLLGTPFPIKGIVFIVDYLRQTLNLTKQGSSNFQKTLSGDDLAELEKQCAWIEKLCNLCQNRGEKYLKEVIYSPSSVPRVSHGPRERLDTFITTYDYQPAFIASTPVTFFRFDGTLAPHSQIPPTTLPLDVRHLPASLSGPAAPPPNTSSMYAPSLLDLAIRASTQHLSHAQILSLLPPDTPPHILQVLDAAENIIARTEWIEYWHCTPDTLFCVTDDLFWPFLRRGCSWGCAFDPAVDELNGHHELADE
jgi:Leucine-rich repeat (LRR) protein